MARDKTLTGHERMLSENQHIVSTTDLRGVIEYANQDFIDICGYSNDELVSHSHNIVRHPEMPKAAFALLWEQIKSGKPWIGIVNNRCKNGDNYWVDAMVTPLKDAHGKIQSYQSVRVKPSSAAKARADQLYTNLNQGKAPINRWQQGLSYQSKLTLCIALPLLLLLAGMAGVGALALMPTLALAALSCLVGWGLASWQAAPISALAKQSRKHIDDPIAQWVYTGRSDDIGQLALGEKYLRSQQTTLTWRLADAAGELDKAAHAASDTSHQVEHEMQQQRTELAQVSHAMEQMSSSVNEVASSIQVSADQAQQADQQVSLGREDVSQAVAQIHQLAQQLDNAKDVVTDVAAEGDKIANFVKVIQEIAERTNLLALNAAIEAARAGEQGRGFAVVAEEVRSLASRTQQSTEEIQSIVGSLQARANEAGTVMSEGQQLAGRSIEQADHINQALEQISDQTSAIRQQVEQIAAAAEQQSLVSKEINDNLHAIDQQSRQTLEHCNSSGRYNDKVAEQGATLGAMVQMFG